MPNSITQIVEVYIWFPAGYKYELTEREFFSSIYSEKNFGSNIFETIQQWERAVGHASLLVRKINGDECYLSFWPDDNKGKGDIITLIRSFVPMKGKFLEEFDKDKKGMGKPPDRTIRLPFLSSTDVYDTVTKLKSRKYSYHIVFQNCSTMVALALTSGIDGKDLIADFKAFYLRLWEVMKLLNTFFSVYRLIYRNEGIYMQHSLRQNISIVGSILSLPEALISVKTPKSVLEYAIRLEKLKSPIQNKLERRLKRKLLDIKEAFFIKCDTAKARLNTIELFSSKIGNSSRGDNQSLSHKNFPKSEEKKSATKTRTKSVSRLVYASIIMALCVQLFRANHWQFLLFKSYEHAFATSFFLAACGVARTAQIWQNSWVSLGIFLTTVGAFAWKYKWVLPIIKTYDIPLCIGIVLILYGLVPQLLGVIFLLPGSILLGNELWLMFTQGLATIHHDKLLAGIILLVFSAVMFRRYKSLEKTGVFRRKKTNNFDA